MTTSLDKSTTQRRRQSAVIYSTAAATGSPGGASTSANLSSSSFGTLQPPPAANTQRHSVGLWGSSKSAASTPNLSMVPKVEKESSVQSSGKSIAESSSSSSFNQRRKRSESISGLKTTAGNITRIVRKSSSNFLKKLVKGFDDKDAPPTPTIPDFQMRTESSPADTRALSSISISSEIHPFDGAEGGNDQDSEVSPPPVPPIKDSTAAALETSVANVESWLNAADAGTPEAAALDDSPELYNADADDIQHLSASAESSDDDDGDDEIPLAAIDRASNRLSKLYETSLHLQSQTSLYYSTKSTLSVPSEFSDEINTSAKRASLIAQVQGTDLSGYSSIRIGDSPPRTHMEIPSFMTSTGTSDKPLPRRPISVFVPLTPTIQDEAGHPLDPSAIETVEPLADPRLTAFHSAPIGLIPTGLNQRPLTICVGPNDDDERLKLIRSGKSAPMSGTEMTPQEQQDATEALAMRTAKRCFKDDESFLRKDEISEFLGALKSFNRIVLVFYMENFDFSGQRVDVAFRLLCRKLILKGETQEVDRILVAFACRYVDCNPRGILGTRDVVHAIAYSILLLNTDLHVVQSSQKMSRSAFVKNTLQAVQAQSSSDRSTDDSDKLSAIGSMTSGNNSTHNDSTTGGTTTKKRTPSVKSWKSSHSNHSSRMGSDPKANGGYGNGKWWLSELEAILKEIYSAVKYNQILLPRSKTAPVLSQSGHGGNGLNSHPHPGIGQRSRSLTLVETDALAEFNAVQNGANVVRRASAIARSKKLRQEAMQRLAAQKSENSKSTHTLSSISTTGSDTSRYSLVPSIMNEAHALESTNNNSKQQRSFGSNRPIMPPGTSSSSAGSHLSVLPVSASTPPVSLASLALSSSTVQSPRSGDKISGGNGSVRYRMEGILWRKHLLEKADKKAQHRAWRQLLVVLDDGCLSMFRADGQLGSAFEEMGILVNEVRLQHTITNILPPPGYSNSRRHVFAIQLYTGAVYLFQTNSAQECEDWAKTCNYWSARTSREPLIGGVINMDYGWGRSLDMLNELEAAQENSTGGGDDDDHHSAHGTGGGGSLHGFGGRQISGVGSTLASMNSNINGGGTHNTKPLAAPGDNATLFEWVAPTPTMGVSQLEEHEQAIALKKYLTGLELEMERHQECRVPMSKLFSPKSNNFTKAFTNWERRSRHLLKEMVKYQVYVECLELSLADYNAEQMFLAQQLLEQQQLEREKEAREALEQVEGHAEMKVALELSVHLEAQSGKEAREEGEIEILPVVDSDATSL